MAKYKAWYASEDEIPQFARDNKLYVQRNGRWEFDHGEFEQLEDLTAPGLAANRDALKNEKLGLQETITAEKLRADTAEAELRKMQKPGSKTITSEDANMLEAYQKLGSPKDLEKMKGEHAEYATKIKNIDTEKDIRKLCEETGLNFEAVNDFVTSNRGTNVKLISKDVKIKDDKGKDTLVKRAFVTVEEDAGNGRFKTDEYELKDYADKNLPSYVAKAMFETKEEDTTQRSTTTTTTSPRLPNLSGGKAGDNTNTDKDAASRAEQFNKQRSNRVLPWEKKEPAQAT